MISNIVQMAKAIAGTTLLPDEEALLERLSEAALSQWSRRLREGTSAADCAGALIPACAWSALSGLMAGRGAVEPMISFQVGDVSVKQQTDAIQVTRTALLRQAEEIMKHYVEDEGLAFLGVRG